MIKLFAVVFLLFSSHSVLAFDSSEAENLVRDYAKTVACVYEFGSQSVQLAGIPGKTESFQDIYVVAWHGDIGCNGGSGTSTANISVVMIAAGSTPVVKTNFPIPQLPFARIKSIKGGKGYLFLEGLTYGPNDPNCCPSEKSTMVLKLNKYQDALVKVGEP